MNLKQHKSRWKLGKRNHVSCDGYGFMQSKLGGWVVGKTEITPECYKDLFRNVLDWEKELIGIVRNQAAKGEIVDVDDKRLADES